MAPKQSALFARDTAPVAPVSEKQSAVAFINWSMTLEDGSVVNAEKGIPLFQNPAFPNEYEDLLIRWANEAGGTLHASLDCRISIFKGASKKVAKADLASLSLSALAPKGVQPVPTETIQ